MTVENQRVVDFVGIDKDDGHIVLTISDHLDWQDEIGHLSSLQEKLNSYLAFVESGELLEQYPNGRGRRVRIDVVLKHPPSREGEQFFRNARAAVAAAGFELEYRVLADVN
jgi:hypothetical protein